MKQGEHVFYHVLYLDEPRIDSILAQINLGKLESTTETQTTASADGSQGQTNGNIGFLSGQVGTNTSKEKSYAVSYTYNDHHAKILQLAKLLQLDLETPVNKLPQHPRGDIFVFKSKLTITDTEVINRQINNSGNMIKIVFRGHIPGAEDIRENKELSSDMLTDMMEIFKNIPKGTYLSCKLENSVIAGGTLDPRCFCADMFNPIFVDGTQMPSDWTVLGYCFSKSQAVTETGIGELSQSMNNLLNTMNLIKASTITVVPLVILR